MKKLLFQCFLLLPFFCFAGVKYDIVVAKDGTGNFTTVQAAINAVKQYSAKRTVIFIKAGVYTEKVVADSTRQNITLLGEDAATTKITWADYSGKGTINTFTSYTFKVAGDGFFAGNLTFENAAGPVGQGVALHIEADKVIITNCRLLGNQDTLFTGKGGTRQYFDHCYIEGTTDFIFGPATAVFEATTTYSKKNSYITAASTPENTPFGYVFFNATLKADSSFKKIYLGRPWRPFAKTVFIHTAMDSSILPEGWHNWNKPDAEKTTLYAEYQSTGPGANPAKRVKWSKQLTDKEVKAYTLKNIFSSWNPFKLIKQYSHA